MRWDSGQRHRDVRSFSHEEVVNELTPGSFIIVPGHVQRTLQFAYLSHSIFLCRSLNKLTIDTLNPTPRLHVMTGGQSVRFIVPSHRALTRGPIKVLAFHHCGLVERMSLVRPPQDAYIDWLGNPWPLPTPSGIRQTRGKNTQTHSRRCCLKHQCD